MDPSSLNVPEHPPRRSPSPDRMLQQAGMELARPKRIREERLLQPRAEVRQREKEELPQQRWRPSRLVKVAELLVRRQRQREREEQVSA